MLISSKAKLIPVLSFMTGLPYFHIYSVTDRRFVEHSKTEKNSAFGEIYREGRYNMDKAVFINLTNDANLKKAAQKLITLRPKATEEYPASILLWNDRTREIEWRKVSKEGKFTLFNGADDDDVPETEGVKIESSSDYVVYFSPLTAIKDAQDAFDADIKEMLGAAKEREDEARAVLKKAKPLIDKIIKAQEI
jgi:hypothetical protein